MEEENRKCFNCGNFGRYYTKEASRFQQTKQGFCSKHAKITDNQDHCEFWRNRNSISSLRKAMATKALKDILTDIAALRQIFEEEREEAKDE